MFGLWKKKASTLFIKIMDVVDIIRHDYEEGISFCMIDFRYCDEIHSMGSCVFPFDAEEIQENIRFVFDNQVYNSIEEYVNCVQIGGAHIFELEEPIEVVRAGVINGETLLRSPWDETRLADYALNKE